jgi:Fur family ferric uptake transcriptional regulator
MSCYQERAQELRQVGFRMTPQRLMIMDAVFHSTGHITAEDIHAQVQARFPYVDLSTVYRTLQVLKEQDMVAELRVPDEPVQYESLLVGSHHHAICRHCGAMLDLPANTLDPIREQLQALTGFRAEFAHMAISGLCAACVEQENGE